MRLLVALTFLALTSTACSNVRSVYAQPGYTAQGPNPIKRIGITAWASGDDKGLSDVLAAVTTDLVKLRKNYLVYDTHAGSRSFTELCKDKVEGVLVARSLGVERTGGNVGLDVALELYRCTDGALVWRAEGAQTVASNNDDLAKLTSNYAASLGDGAKVFAAPAFSLLQQLVAELPDPALTDDDINEKIELG